MVDSNTVTVIITSLKGQSAHALIREPELLEWATKKKKTAANGDAFFHQLEDGRAFVVGFVRNPARIGNAATASWMAEEIAYAATKRGYTEADLASPAPYKYLRRNLINSMKLWISLRYVNS